MNGPSQPLSKKLTHLRRVVETSATAAQCKSLLDHCAQTKSLRTTKGVHAHTITLGLLQSSSSTHLLSLLTAAYALCGHSSYARKLFDELPQRTLLSYRTMIRMYTEKGSPKVGLKLFSEMLRSDRHIHMPDRHTFPYVIRACSDLFLLQQGVVVHGLIVVCGFMWDPFVGNSLLAMYMSCGDKDGARRVFDAMEARTVVTWNTMISGYRRNDCPKEALMIFRRMVDTGVEADCATVLSLLPACGCMKDFEMGREVHSLVEQLGFWDNLSVRNAVVDMYVKCGRMNEARLVFEKMISRDVVTWTTMINGFISDGDIKNALWFSQRMQLEGVKPNAATLALLLAVCASLPHLRLGKCLHGWAIRQDLQAEVNVETGLIDMYAKCNCFSLSYQVFATTSKKRTVPWNAILSGCIHNELAREAIELFKLMLSESVKPNDATLMSVLPAYAIEADLRQALSIHGYLVRSGFVTKTEVATGLVDIYSKSGNLDNSHKIFNGIPKKERDIILWSTLIAGYGMHGHGEVSLSLFYQMVKSGINPNEVTFTSVLHACGHAGLVDEGLCLFHFMLRNHSDRLRTDHYTCMVDLLGRAGRLDEAYELMKTMTSEPSRAVWGALLGACVIYENVELGELAARWLFKLEPENTGNYVLLGKIYSAAGRWKDAENVRVSMDEVGLVKAPAQSVIG